MVLLQMEPGKWAGWIMTDSNEMVKLVDEQLQETADWENNFKALKVSVCVIERMPPNTLQLQKCCVELPNW